MIRKTLLALALSLGLCNLTHAAEGLNTEQMGDLIMHGQMTGADGARYDVWIVPGYAGPLENAAEGWQAAGTDLSQYGQAAFYGDIADTSGRMLRFAGQDVIIDFAFKGSADAWRDAFKAAQKRVDQEVFGWWFAYPWAVIEAMGESTLRIVIGVPGGVVIAGLGTTVVPAVQLVWPAGKSVYHAAFKGTILPVAAAAWNTVIAPPMALTGSPPTPARADGFWMKRLNPADGAKIDPGVAQIKAALQQWRAGLTRNAETQALATEEKELQRVYRERLKALNDELAAGRKQLAERRVTIIMQKAGAADSFPEDARKPLAEVLRRYGKAPLIEMLRGDGISREQAEALLVVLLGPEAMADVSAGETAGPSRTKTDPVQRSLEKVLK